MNDSMAEATPPTPLPHNGGMAVSAYRWWCDHLWSVDSFEVTADHLALLRRAYIDWIGSEDYGSLGLSVKRPFRNSDIYRDIAETVDGAYLAALGPGAQDDHLEANADRYEQLPAETGLALQIALETGAVEHGGLKPRRYVRDGIPARWRPAN